MFKKYIIYPIALFVLGTIFVGCFPEKSETALIYDGPVVAEIKNFTFGQQTSVLNAKGVVAAVAQTDSSRTVLLNVRGTDSVLVQLVGPQSAAPIDVNFKIRATSTAVEGTHYNLVPAGVRKVTFAPNTSLAYIKVNMVANSLTTVGDQRTVIFDLQSDGQVKPNPNFNKFIITLRR
ncbi:hypothetical protein GM921_12660 [Pedobacter sp. LMG 31464]|uniref:DUF4843 domain-containing protein n=1 Tax=Pedobacter planticolens TaxID=2679964 RepID=A0A923E155_9SPHI|nr:hypothetical protein [Pedobacter planticolens]MBB2146345.1 hypothetical protein [Pedobacter planticolens]